MHNNSRPLRFPQDILRFLYWIFFKPNTFRRTMHIIDTSISRYGYSNLYQLWKRREGYPKIIPIIWLSLFNIIFMPLLAFPLAWTIQLAGFEISWYGVAVGVAGGVVFGVAFGVALDVAHGVAFSVAIGIGFGMGFGVGYGVAFGVAVGMAGGMAGGVALSGEYDGRMWYGVVGGVILGVLVGMTGGDVVLGLVVGMAFIFSCLRLPLYFIYIPWSWMHNKLYREGGLVRSSVLVDELIWFPLPGLSSLLVQISQQDRQQGLEAIAFVAGSIGQRWAAKRSLLELTAYDINQSSTLSSIAEISGNLAWLPDDARMGLQELLLGLEQASQHARAALESETLYNKQEQLRMGLQVVERIQSGLAYAEKSEIARLMFPPLSGWKNVFMQELAQASGREQIPNVYHSGTPLIKDSKTFKGRRDLFHSLGNELINPSGQRPALLLFGARRMGKSSTLKQLPVQLGPQIIPATLDLQASGAVKNTASLLYLLTREITRSARQERRLQLPELTREQLEKDPYLVFQDWLEQVEKKLGDYYWVLLALDEFEALGEMLEAGRTDERIFQTLRGLMQNHPRITVLMSGAHTLEELPPLWSNYLINTRMLKVGPLADADARELILRPIPDFPLTYDEDAV
ncbi:MAG: AAA family ATPase, partial [Chloroflexota bacterium]